MNLFVASLITLGVIGCVAAVVLYFVAQKFKVVEDERIDLVEAVLPGANCGGCGYPGCRGFADACVKADSLDGKLCPVGGQPVMSKVAEILGMAVDDAAPKVAVLRCNGNCTARPRTSEYNGARSCNIANLLYAGETGCSYGCMGMGDCEKVCKFDALHINLETGLPEIDEEKCTACGACVKACPKHIIELRNKGMKNRRVYVACANKDKGGVARKACASACIGCGKCMKACPFGAITIENNLAYINFELCRLCRKCVNECPTGAIHDINFPTPAPAVVKPASVAKPVSTPAVEQVKPVAEPVKPTGEPAIQPVIETIVEPVVRVESENVKPAASEVVVPENTAEKSEIEMIEVVETVVLQVESAGSDEPVKEKMPEEPKVVSAQETIVNQAQTPEITIESEEESKSVSDEAHTVSEEKSPIIDIPDDVDVKELIDPSLRVVPRDKLKDDKPEKKNSADNQMPTLGF